MLADGYQIRALRREDWPALAAAYRRNREHLAPWDPERPEEFYTDTGQQVEVARNVAAAAEDRLHAYLIWYGEEQVVGRVMLANFVRGVLQSATLGYWVDHEHLGRGLATAGVEHALGEARRFGLHRLEAGTMVHNTASQAVLKRSGFTEFGTAERFLFINGTWEDHVLFQRILHDDPPGNPTP